MVPFCGIRDRVIEFADGSRYVMDTKTTRAFLTDAYFDRYTVSPQLMGYVAMERAAGRRCDGAYIDAVCLNPKAKSAIFVRHGPIRYADHVLKAWARDVARAARQIGETRVEIGESATWEQRWEHCFQYGQPCPYLRLCLAAPELRGETVAEGYRVEHWRPAERAQGG